MHIEQLQALIQPLLQSPLVGEGPAFDAEVAVASSLPGKLGRHALAVATALQVVELCKTGYTPPRPYMLNPDSSPSSSQNPRPLNP